MSENSDEVDELPSLILSKNSSTNLKDKVAKPVFNAVSRANQMLAKAETEPSTTDEPDEKIDSQKKQSENLPA